MDSVSVQALKSGYSSDGELNQVGQTIKSAFKDGRNFNGVTISLAYMF